MEVIMSSNAHLSRTENVRMLRKLYRKPQLEVLGDLRSLTLGGSFGTGESGSTVRKVQTGLIPLPGDFPQPPDGFPKPGEPPKP